MEQLISNVNKQIWVDAWQHQNKKDHFGPNFSLKVFFGGFSPTIC